MVEEISKELQQQLKRKATALKPVAWVGKNGLNDSVISEIKKHLKKRKLIKIKVLKSYIDESGMEKKAIAREIAANLDAHLVQTVGFAIVLYSKSTEK